MSWHGPDDPHARVAWRRARRRVARDLHPDVGGDPGGYLSAITEVDERFGAGPVDLRRTGLVRLRRTIQRRLRRTRGQVRRVRARLPRRLPGSRRYIDL